MSEAQYITKDYVCIYRGWTKLWKHYRYCTHFFINMVLVHLLPQPFLEWTHTSFEQSLMKFYTILLEEHLQVALEMLEVESLLHSSLQN
jgi:hypothetical protein